MSRNLPQIAPDPLAGPSIRRRDFINIAAVSAAGVGALATLVPIIGQMWPSADVLAATNPLSVDISALEPG
jgi:ubiquinol-cytochrome c reductase iron-sulfur subunit